MTDAVVIAIITAIGAVIAGFFKLIDNQNKLHEKLSVSIDNMAESSRKVAKSHDEGNAIQKQGFQEAEKRNGHLAEITIQQADRVIDSVTHIKEQKVKNQVVENEVVNKKG